MFENIIEKIRGKERVAEIDLNEIGKDVLIKAVRESIKKLSEEHDTRIEKEEIEMNTLIISFEKEQKEESKLIEDKKNKKISEARTRFDRRVKEIKEKYIPEITKFKTVLEELETKL